jgi:outer membrane protein OmpA-like peptidoglycan-associated protein
MSSIKLDGTWTKPLNLGFPINTFDNEGSIAVKGNGAEGYIASDRQDSRGGLDIYKVVLSPLTRANKTYYFNGFIADATTKKPLAGIVNLVDPIASENFMQVSVDSTGYFVLALPYFDSLGIRINSEAHEYASMLISADSLNKISGNTFNFYLAAIEKQYSKKFNNVFFDLNTAQLKKSASVELDALVSYLSTTPNATILIEGHTDNTGTVAFNLALSSQRAQAIAHYLITGGINKLRISTQGYGATKPVASNDTEAGRALNRRTGFTITIQ